MRRLIGNTPLLSLALRVNGEPRTIYAKYEPLNLTGSIKDRMALHILRRAYETGQIQPGDPIAEATSGNTGISFAAIGRALGHPVTVFMPDWMSSERISLIASFGASVVLVSKADGGFLGSIARADAMKESNPRTFLPHQFSNEANIDAHVTGTGPEIWLQLQGQGLS
ncbi:MAG: pyridoxal-phosphate dependent enzyme, partial [Acidobacteriota bacterium]|nr:pyridoxal-phosphate dependent enzyme [Acidobacteriota bacterium]